MVTPLVRTLLSCREPIPMKNPFQKSQNLNPANEMDKFKFDLGMTSSSQNIRKLFGSKRTGSGGWNRKNQLMMGRFG